jgi:rRNA-processing protein FCF1
VLVALPRQERETMMARSSKKYMLDTNIFDSLAKGRFAVDRLPSDGKLYATAVQFEELKDTRDSEKRSRLMERFTEIIDAPGMMLRAAFAFDVAGAGFDQGHWRSDGALYYALKKDLDAAWDRKPKKEQRRSKRQNSAKDALIAEAAQFNGCTLLTCDGDLAEAAAKHGINVLRLSSDGSAFDRSSVQR